MADAKFTLIKEQLVGRLRLKDARKWQSLLRKRDALKQKMTLLEAEADAFTQGVVEPYLPEEADPGESFEFRIGQDGQIFQVHCDCPACQAALQGLTVTAVVEGMIKQGLIAKGEVDSARKKAQQIDAQKIAAQKKKSLLN